MNWADDDFNVNISIPLVTSDSKNQYLSYSSVVTGKPTIPIPQNHPPKVRCYTCKPRGKVKKHIISTIRGFAFHHDMHKRPVILVTPKQHYQSIEQMSPDQMFQLFGAIGEFCSFWNIKDYQVSWNCGAWKTHEHLHIKIKTHDRTINQLRRDHFQRLRLEKNYLTPVERESPHPQ